MIWVRSQDKEILVETSNFRICEGWLANGKVKYYTIDVDVPHEEPFTFEIGKYSTKEKALKVLDKIQEAIVPKLIIDVDGRVEKNENMVFQMPQDDEVKEDE